MHHTSQPYCKVYGSKSAEGRLSKLFKVKGSNQMCEDEPQLVAKPSTCITKPSSSLLNPLLFPRAAAETGRGRALPAAQRDPSPALLQPFHFDPLGQTLAPRRSLFACTLTSDSL